MDIDESRLGSDDGEPARRRPGRPSRAFHQSVADGRERAERGDEERETVEDRELSDDERLVLFRSSLHQTVLPDLPPMPGYHVCWLTTTNPRDSIPNRMRLGYELVRLDSIPGWDGLSLKTGDYAGCVGINEMVAARIPLSLYNRYMREVHHAMPMSEEEKMKERVDLMKHQAKQAGASVYEGDGTAEIVQRARPMADLYE